MRHLALVLGLAACSSGPNPDTLPPAEAVADKVAAHTEGTVSRTEAVEVQFTTDVGAAGRKVPSPFTFTPAVRGEARWSSPRALSFTPDSPLDPGATYAIAVDLGAVNPSWSSETFRFDIDVLPSSFRTRIHGLEADDDAGTTQRLTGSVITADDAAPEDVEAMLDATQGDRRLTAAWTHDDARRHQFTLTGITRADEATTVTLAFDGTPLGIDRTQVDTVPVPALGAFELLGAQPIIVGARTIELRFSDPLDPRQDLRNHITVEGHPQLTFEREGSTLRVFSAARLASLVQVQITGVCNTRGACLDASEAVSFERLKPEVRFAGTGVILPASDDLILPLETANLSAVVLTASQVFADNVPQFLQVNALDGHDGITRVGKPVWRKRILIDATADRQDRWVRTGLDLSELADLGTGMLHLEATFGPSDIVYPCSEPPPEPRPLPPLAPDWQAQQVDASYWDMWSDGDGGLMPWELWQGRHDPCNPGYYRDYDDHDVAVTRNVLVSNLGIVAKRGGDGTVHAHVTDLRTTAPIANAKLTLLDYTQQTVATATTDAQGHATMASDEAPFLLRVDKGDDVGWLKLGTSAALSTSHFETSGTEVQAGLKGHLFAERGVWRPGDDIHLFLALQDETGVLPDGHPVQFSLRNPRGQLVDHRTVTASVGPFTDLHTTTASDAPTGTWTATAEVGGATFRKSLRVETVVPNRLKIDLPLPDQPITDARLDTTLTSRWLHGATAKGLDAEIELSLHPAATTFPGLSDYTFHDPTAEVDTEPTQLFAGTLDAQGATPVDVPLPLPDRAPGMLTAKLKTRVFEPSGATSREQTAVVVSPHDRYVGLKTPKGDAARGMLLTDEPHTVELLTVDTDGTPYGNGTVEVALYKVDWRWWWEKGPESFAQYAGATTQQAMQQGTVQMEDGRGQWSFQVDYPTWGRFLLVAKDADGTHTAGKVVYIDWPGWAGRADASNPGSAAVLAVTASETSVDVGDTVSLDIPTGEGGRALVSLETGDRVLGTHWVEATGETTTFTFETTPDMAPSVYAHVTLIQPHAADNDRPMRLYGIQPIEVIDPTTRLDPVLTTPDVLRPDEPATVTVSEAQGTAMAYTLMVVDEGLLGLTRFATPDPWGAFYAREALGVHTWDVYSQVLGGTAGALEALVSVGGGGSEEAGDSRTNRFAPVVQVLGPFELPAGETATHTLTVTNYVGEVRVMVVAGDGHAWGHDAASVPVTSPLMALATVPRVLGPSEQFQLPVDLFALEEDLGTVTVTATVSGPLTLSGTATQTVPMDAGDDALLTYGIAVDDALGDAAITITATGGGHTATTTVPVTVRHPGSPITEVSGGVAKAGETWSSTLDRIGLDGTNEVYVEVSRIPPIDLARHLDGLVRYPHGCLEQTTSRAFPQLRLTDLVDLPDATVAKTRHHVREAIDKLGTFQLSSGAFAYWPGERAAQPWSTTYAGHFLVEAERAGFLLPPGMVTRWVRHEQDAAARWVKDDPRADLAQAYRLYALALAGEPEIAAMNRLQEMTLSDAARWRLAAAYAHAGQPEVAQRLADAAGLDVSTKTELSGTFGSPLRDQAMILEALVLLEDDRAPALAQQISDAMQSPRNTQATAMVLLAMARFGEASGGKTTARWAAGGASGTLDTAAPLAQVALGEPEDGTTLTIDNTGTGTLYTRLVRRGLPPVGADDAVQGTLSIAVVYVDAQGQPVDPRAAPQGTDFTAQVTVRNDGRALDELALTHVVPSGWEIEAASPGPLPDDAYRDVRDDRVHTYFDLDHGESRTFAIGVHSAFEGSFYLAPIQVEAMYDATIRARTAGQWVTVSRPGDEG